jgi:hypothetical protein
VAETFETLKTQLNDWLGTDLTRFPDSVRGFCVNEVQRRLLRKHDLRFGEITDTLAVSANDGTYDLPSAWRSPLNFWYISPETQSLVSLANLQKDEFDARFPDPSETGTVTHYSIWGQVIYLGATPNQSLTLNRNYFRYLPDLADGSPDNTNPLIEEAADILLFGALAFASRYLIEDPRVNLWEALYADLEADLVSAHQRARSVGRVPQAQEPG